MKRYVGSGIQEVGSRIEGLGSEITVWGLTSQVMESVISFWREKGLNVPALWDTAELTSSVLRVWYQFLV